MRSQQHKIQNQQMHFWSALKWVPGHNWTADLFLYQSLCCVFQGDLNGHRGLVPSNFLQALPEEAPPEPVSAPPAPEPKKESQVDLPLCLCSRHHCGQHADLVFVSCCQITDIRELYLIWFDFIWFDLIFHCMNLPSAVFCSVSLTLSWHLSAALLFPAWPCAEAETNCTLWDLIVSVFSQSCSRTSVPCWCAPSSVDPHCSFG